LEVSSTSHLKNYSEHSNLNSINNQIKKSELFLGFKWRVRKTVVKQLLFLLKASSFKAGEKLAFKAESVIRFFY